MLQRPGGSGWPAARRGPNRLRIVPSMACLRLFDLEGVRHLLPLIDTLG